MLRVCYRSVFTLTFFICFLQVSRDMLNARVTLACVLRLIETCGATAPRLLFPWINLFHLLIFSAILLIFTVNWQFLLMLRWWDAPSQSCQMNWLKIEVLFAGLLLYTTANLKLHRYHVQFNLLLRGSRWLAYVAINRSISSITCVCVWGCESVECPCVG